MPHFSDSPTRRAGLWLTGFALIGALLVWLYPDAEQQDSANHFLFARWAVSHPRYFVSVWGRPLFTLVYFLPSQFGYPAAKLFTVALCLATAWQTFRLADWLRLKRAELAVPLLFLQPVFFALCSEVMTEALFAFLFIIALRLHLAGRIKTGMIVASLLILVRPEGFFIGILWGLWGLRIVDCELRNPQPLDGWHQAQTARLKFRQWIKEIRNPQFAIRILQCLLLASGMVIWWLAAYWLTGDPLWILHNWPPDWQVDGQANGTGPIWWYAALLPLIAGIPLFVPFLVGLWKLLRSRELIFARSSFLTLFVLHSLMFTQGWFGSAGYARYFVCVSPVTALIALVGWNELAAKRPQLWIQTGSLILAALTCVVYLDSIRFSRDAFAVEEMYEWIDGNSTLIDPSSADYHKRLITSQAYPRTLLDRDPLENPAFTADAERNRELIRQLPEGALVLWEDETGPKWYRLRAEDFQAAGFELLKSQDFKLQGYVVRLPWSRWGGWRSQRMHWLYKRPSPKP